MFGIYSLQSRESVNFGRACGIREERHWAAGGLRRRPRNNIHLEVNKIETKPGPGEFNIAASETAAAHRREYNNSPPTFLILMLFPGKV